MYHCVSLRGKVRRLLRMRGCRESGNTSASQRQSCQNKIVSTGIFMSGSPSLPDQISVSLFQCGQQNRTGRRRPGPALRGPHSQACPPSCATARQGWDLETACPEHRAACSSCEHEQVSKEENQCSRHAKAHTQTWDGGSSGRGVLSVPIWALPWEVWVSRPRKVAREGTGLSADPAQDRDSLRGQSLDLRESSL